MKKILFGAVLLVGLNAESVLTPPPTVVQPIAPERPTKPIVITKTYGVNHHTDIITTESSCDEYIEIIKEKDAKIEALLKENARLKEEAQTGLQERLKKEYDKEMQKFENR